MILLYHRHHLTDELFSTGQSIFSRTNNLIKRLLGKILIPEVATLRKHYWQQVRWWSTEFLYLPGIGAYLIKQISPASTIKLASTTNSSLPLKGNCSLLPTLYQARHGANFFKHYGLIQWLSSLTFTDGDISGWTWPPLPGVA